ncbi:NUDIX domain-containing protein [Clostridium cadaveris]|uniref:NUDIX domain-containing protein n=1 Tax=Clostridium cadaveris TaxID=1529 RepID=UPI0015D4F64F|nr:NUDIX domain-containing protein [Clostridium cadaveris]
MSRNENAIFTNMCMVYDKEKILIQNRLNINWPGVTFPGGHVEYAESFTNSVI